MAFYVAFPPNLPALWAGLGYRDRAKNLIRFVPYDRAGALADLAGAVAGRGDLGRAVALARSIEFQRGEVRDRYQKARAWAELAWMAARAGDREFADDLIGRAESLVEWLTDMPYLQAQVLMGLARVAAACERRDQADELSGEAESLASSTLNEPSWWQWVMDVLPVAATGAGRYDQAERMVRSIPDPYHQARAVAALALIMAADAHHARAENLARSITDRHRHARTAMAMGTLGAVRGAGAASAAGPYWWAWAVTALAEMVAAGGSHAWGASDWAEPLVRCSADPDDQVRIFGALAAAVAGGDRERAAALADRAEALAQVVSDPEDRPQALTSVAWMVTAAGDHGRAITLARAAEALAMNPGRWNRRTWTVAELATAVPVPLEDRADDVALPEMTGSAKQRAWARDLRHGFVDGRWGGRIPPSVREQLLRLTDSRWWIDNRDRLDEALAAQDGVRDDELVPELTGTPKQVDWAQRVRAEHIRERWAGGIPPEARAVLATLTAAGWWLDNRDALDTALTAEIQAYRRARDPWDS